MSTDQVVCKIAEVIGVQIQDDLTFHTELSTSVEKRPILAKFVSHKVKLKVCKARTNLKSVYVSNVFPDCSVETMERAKRIFIDPISYRDDGPCSKEKRI